MISAQRASLGLGPAVPDRRLLTPCRPTRCSAVKAVVSASRPATLNGWNPQSARHQKSASRPAAPLNGWNTQSARHQKSHLQICRARGPSTEEIIRNIDTAKIEKREDGIVQTLRETVFSLGSLAPVLLGMGGGYVWLQNTDGVAVGAALGSALRAAQILFLQQSVPFTQRKHTLLLPVGIELQMGAATFAQQLNQYEQQGKLLKSSTSEYRMIKQIADRVIAAVGKQEGGGFQSHVPKFQWEVVVVNDKTPNAFVLPGGKIVVFTGLIKLMDQREDLLAAVIGHEVAHALARHSSEKLSLGLFITIVANLAIALLTIYGRQKDQQQGRGQSQRGGYGGGYGTPMGAMGGRGGYGRGAPRQGNPLLNPQVLSIFTNLFLQLPFSRRAEAEADLIGLKLMALAGYDPHMAPETFRKLSTAEQGRPGGNLGSLGCTHPRSDSRVQMLEEELAMMAQAGKEGNTRVLHKMPYWML